MGRGKQKTATTSRITNRERAEFNDSVDCLTARHRLAHRCPLKPEDLVALWRANMSPVDLNFWLAAQAKAQSGDDLYFIIKPEAQGVLCDFDFGRVCLQIPKATFEEGKFPIWDRQRDMSFVDPAVVLGADLHKELREWALNAIHIHTRVEMTRQMLKEILNISNTIGQINRMAPELVKYANPLTQQALTKQERRSPLPEEWMQIDRTVMRSSLDHLTFCYLLPRVEESEVDADSLPWCWDGPGIGCARYTVRPEPIHLRQLSTYKLPFDPNPMELGTFISPEKQKRGRPL